MPDMPSNVVAPQHLVLDLAAVEASITVSVDLAFSLALLVGAGAWLILGLLACLAAISRVSVPRPWRAHRPYRPSAVLTTRPFSGNLWHAQHPFEWLEGGPSGCRIPWPVTLRPFNGRKAGVTRMSNPLTGDFEAVLDVSGGTINHLLASMHQNAGYSGAA